MADEEKSQNDNGTQAPLSRSETEDTGHSFLSATSTTAPSKGLQRYLAHGPIADDWSRPRKLVAYVIKTDAFDALMISIILVNLCLVVAEADANVDGNPPGWMQPVGYIFLGVYIFEIASRIFVDRMSYFLSKMNCVDTTIVILDAVFQILIDTLVGKVPSISILRVVRVMRLVRVIRAFRSFRELWLMLHGLAAAMKAMLWALVLIFVFLVIWSVVSVEILHEISKSVLEDSVITSECERCSHAFQSVMDSMITWFILVFAGDMWADLAQPIIEKEPLTAIIFLSAFVSINLGMLNLILTVIVDRASEARADDESQRVIEKKNEFDRAKHKLTKLCARMDEDHSGCLSLEEFENGWDTLPEFQAIMRIMDVDKEDIKTVFNILDEDRSGTVTYAEFVDQLYKMKAQESHTLLIFIKHYLTDVRIKVTEQLQLFKEEVLMQETHQKEEFEELKRIFCPGPQGRSQGVSRQISPGSPRRDDHRKEEGETVWSSEGTSQGQPLARKSNRITNAQASSLVDGILEPLTKYLDEQFGLIREEAAARSKQQAILNESLSQIVSRSYSNGFCAEISKEIGAVVVPVVVDPTSKVNVQAADDDSGLVVPVQVIRPGMSSGRPQFMM